MMMGLEGHHHTGLRVWAWRSEANSTAEEAAEAGEEAAEIEGKAADKEAH